MRTKRRENRRMTVNLMTNLFIPLILALAPALMGYIIWILQEQRKETAEIKRITAEEFGAIKQGLMELLLENIAEAHEKYVIGDRPLTIACYNRIIGIFSAYKKLGGNGAAEKMMDEIKHENIDGGH